MSGKAPKKLAVGFFDGVHIAHREILKGADEALTLSDHPLSVLAPEKAPRLLMSFEERIRAIGLPVKVLTFDRETAKMSAADFAERYLEGYIIRCGENWRFGRGGLGNVEWLKNHGFEVEVVPVVTYRGEAVSSTRIRSAIASGKIAEAEAMLGRRLELEGSAFKGKGVGKTLGYPTINVELADDGDDLKKGVYSAVVNYGTAPTMKREEWRKMVMEVHLIERLRDERAFPTREELCKQISEDVRQASAQSKFLV